MIGTIKIPFFLKKKNNPTPPNDTELRELLYHKLKDAYWTGIHLSQTLSYITKFFLSKELGSAFRDLDKLTKKHTGIIKNIFKALGKKAGSIENEKINNILKDMERSIAEISLDPVTKDIKLIALVQEVEAHEITEYEKLAEMIEMMGLNKIRSIIEAVIQREIMAYSLFASVNDKIITSLHRNRLYSD